MTFSDTQLIGIGAVVILGGVLLARSAKAAVAETAATVGAAVDPTSRENIFYRGVNAVGATVTADAEFSLGKFFFELTHPESKR